MAGNYGASVWGRISGVSTPTIESIGLAWWIFAVLTVFIVGAATGYCLRHRAAFGDAFTKYGFEAFAVVVAIAIGGSTLYYAQVAVAREGRQERGEFSHRVYLGEAPQYYSMEMPKDMRCADAAGCRDRVVMNASGTQINSVWVEYADGSRVKIVGIQRCTLYDLPLYADSTGQVIEPRLLHFSDPHGHWSRSPDGTLEIIDKNDIPDDGDNNGIPDDAEFGESNALDIHDCSG